MRLQSDHVNRAIVPAFYRYLQSQEVSAQINARDEFLTALEDLVKLLERAEEMASAGGFSGEGEKRAKMLGLGLWMKDGDLGWTDVIAGPCKLSLLSLSPVIDSFCDECRVIQSGQRPYTLQGIFNACWGKV